MANVNAVTLTGNLTKDVETKTLDSGTTIANLRVAVNTNRKVGNDWVDVPGYFNVTVFNGQAKAASEYLSKGSKVAVQGRLDWREYEVEAGKREAVSIIANTLEFLSPRKNDTTEEVESEEE